MRIALTYTGSEEKHNNYVQWLTGNDAIEVIKISAEENNLKAVSESDALVLSGGRDIQPQFYNSTQTNYPNAPQNFDEARDAFEIAVFQLAEEKHLPVLGICRGLQLVNCIQGGTLLQDLGEGVNEKHKAAGNDKLHRIHIQEHTLLQEITQVESTWVNSAHHQAIDQLGKALRVNCWAEDGTIEGVEWEEPSGKPFLLCVQWHPERMFQWQLEKAPTSQAIRYGFFNAIKKSKAGK